MQKYVRFDVFSLSRYKYWMDLDEIEYISTQKVNN